MNRNTAIFVHLVLWLIAAAVLITRPLFASRDENSSGPAQAEEDASPAAIAAVAPLFNYQGELRNASGSAITNSAMPMSFRLFTAPTGGSACWLENRTVNVQNGQFNVVLGQVTAIPSSCVTGNAYLELVINSETLAPREMLTSVASAVVANTLSSGAQVQGPLSVNGNLVATDAVSAWDFNGMNLHIGGGTAFHTNETDRILHLLPWTGSGYRYDKVCIGCGTGADLRVNGSTEVDGNLVATGEVSAWDLIGMNLHIGGGTAFHTNTTDRILHLLPWAGSGQAFDRVCIGCGFGNPGLIVAGNLDLRGTCLRTSLNAGKPQATTETNDECRPGSILSGAYVEANLMTNEELSSERIERFAEGDVLCWAGEQLEKCDQPNDRLVQAVAGADGKPIIVGAEQIRVLGPVTMGDILVASSVPGYAMVNNDPRPGTVIGQALENLAGERGLIKAMIRKW